MNKYIFYKTNRSFNNFKSLSNHIRSYAKKNDYNLNILLKENYDYFSSDEDRKCIHCNSECEYINYIVGYKNPCFNSECYKNFVNNNKEYYKTQTKLSYFDLYDNHQYSCAFSKRYFDIVNEKINKNKNFIVNNQCEICNSPIKDISVFSRDIKIKTCSLKCKGIKISKETLRKKVFKIDEFNGNINALNHYIFKNRRYPVSNDNVTNLSVLEQYENIPILKIPHKNSKIYFSKKYNLFFFKILNFNSLYEYLNCSDTEYLKYHTENSLGKCFCPGCNKNILFTDVFDTKIISNKFCTKECYYKTLTGKKVEEKIKNKMSDIMKRKILCGEYTPIVTNSWCKSKTRVIINGEEKYVRSSWEAVFWALNSNMIYEKIRIPYTNVNGKNRNYIVDFYCEESSTLFEIKPKSERNTVNNILKEQAAVNYCKDYNMKYQSISEDYFNDNLSKIVNSKILNHISKETLEKFLRGIGRTDFKLDYASHLDGSKSAIL